MAKYLNPKADLTFKKIFGEHPNLVISLLNALLPLKADGMTALQISRYIGLKVEEIDTL